MDKEYAKIRILGQSTTKGFPFDCGRCRYSESKKGWMVYLHCKKLDTIVPAWGDWCKDFEKKIVEMGE